MDKPEVNEYIAYQIMYVKQVPEGLILNALEQTKNQVIEAIDNTSEDQFDHRYAEGKWSLREVFAHIIDTERIFQYRALRISRGDITPLKGFDQDEYIDKNNFDHRSKSDLKAEYEVVANSSIHLYKNMLEKDSRTVGTASNNAVTPRALAYITAGHALHHLNIIKEHYI